jgi:hypothetical protein
MSRSESRQQDSPIRDANDLVERLELWDATSLFPTQITASRIVQGERARRRRFALGAMAGVGGLAIVLGFFCFPPKPLQNQPDEVARTEELPEPMFEAVRNSLLRTQVAIQTIESAIHEQQSVANVRDMEAELFAIQIQAIRNRLIDDAIQFPESN